MPPVAGTLLSPGGPGRGLVKITLVGAGGYAIIGYTSTGEVALPLRVQVDDGGAWSETLFANDDIIPSGTAYRVEEQGPGGVEYRFHIEVPDGAGPYFVGDLLTDPPASIGGGTAGPSTDFRLVEHGADPNVARPAVSVVYWVGDAEPVNALEYDLWFGPAGVGGGGVGFTQEQIEDFIGLMVSSNTESGITVTYDDATGKFNFTVTGGTGTGLPAGGTAGQPLVKQSSTDGDADWMDGATVETVALPLAHAGAGGPGTVTDKVSGAGHFHPATVTARVVTGSTTLILADGGAHLEVNSAGAAVVTVPLDVTVDFPVGQIITVSQEGAGQVSIAPEGALTLHSEDEMRKVAARYVDVTLRKRAANDWRLSGALAP